MSWHQNLVWLWSCGNKMSVVWIMWLCLHEWEWLWSCGNKMSVVWIMWLCLHEGEWLWLCGNKMSVVWIMWLCLHEWEYWNVCIVVQYRHEPCRFFLVCFCGFSWIFCGLYLIKVKKRKRFCLMILLSGCGGCVCVCVLMPAFDYTKWLNMFSVFFILYSVLHITFSMYNSI